MFLDILTKTQQRILRVIAGNNALCERFYLTGGTALTGFYFGHRYSEDLDFFSFNEVDPLSINVFLKQYKKELEFDSFQYQQNMNRNLYFLKYGADELKMEFTFFPFLQIDKPINNDGLRIDSAMDIAVNKLFTIYQRCAARDYIDLYVLCEKREYKIDDLIAKARVKFDWHIDLLQLGTQFFKAGEAIDFPRMIVDIKPDQWRGFFIHEAEKLKDALI
ncbi:MAG: nucleotidyl transferase AbiEii/AbiGii toxin family protein [Parcubacteria group bacterium]|nr:nucleotidyl transferase AbiEii/AbiGii toxin family protein [Parcubacteria group bacterium]